MSVMIESVRRAPNELWDETWKNSFWASYYQSREWSDVWNRYSNGRISPAALDIRFSDGKRAVLPFSRQRYAGGIYTKYISSLPNSRSGGWLSVDDLEKEHAHLLSNYIVKHFSNIMLYFNPLDPIVNYVTLPKRLTQNHHIIRTDIRFEDLYGKIHRKQRGAINKANKSGISIRFADKIDDWRKFYKVYQDSLRRWGKNVIEIRDWKSYEIMHARQSPNMKMWIAEYNEEVIGGMLVFFSSHIVTPWSINTIEKYFHLRPASLLYCALIKYACDNGYEAIDLGMSGNIRGLIEFKERFCAQPVRAYKYTSKSKIFKIIQSPIHSFKKYL